MNETAGTSHSTCRLRGIDQFLNGRGCSGARSRSITQRITCSITGNPVRFCNYGDESAVGWASNVADTVHVSALPCALMQNEALGTNEALDILSAQHRRLTGLSTEPLVTHCTPLRHPNHRLHQREVPVECALIQAEAPSWRNQARMLSTTETNRVTNFPAPFEHTHITAEHERAI